MMELFVAALPLFIAALVVGVVVGLTGMGGGAIMTPMLVLGFGVLLGVGYALST